MCPPAGWRPDLRGRSLDILLASEDTHTFLACCISKRSQFCGTAQRRGATRHRSRTVAGAGTMKQRNAGLVYAKYGLLVAASFLLAAAGAAGQTTEQIGVEVSQLRGWKMVSSSRFLFRSYCAAANCFSGPPFVMYGRDMSRPGDRLLPPPVSLQPLRPARNCGEQFEHPWPLSGCPKISVSSGDRGNSSPAGQGGSLHSSAPRAEADQPSRQGV